MEQVSDIRREPGSDIVCLEGNGARPSHHGDGWRVGQVMQGKLIVYELSDELGWHTDSTDIDTEQCRWGTEDAG